MHAAREGPCLRRGCVNGGRPQLNALPMHVIFGSAWLVFKATSMRGP